MSCRSPDCQFLLLFKSNQGAGERGTYRGLDLRPGHVPTRLELGRVVAEHALLQDLGLALAEVAQAQEGDGIGGRAGEEGDEDDADEDGEDALELDGC